MKTLIASVVASTVAAVVSAAITVSVVGVRRGEVLADDAFPACESANVCELLRSLDIQGTPLLEAVKDAHQLRIEFWALQERVQRLETR